MRAGTSFFQLKKAPFGLLRLALKLPEWDEPQVRYISRAIGQTITWKVGTVEVELKVSNDQIECQVIPVLQPRSAALRAAA